MKTKKISKFALVILLTLSSCSKVVQNEYLDKSTMHRFGKEDVEIVIGDNTVGDKYAIGPNYGNRLSFQDFIVRNYSWSQYTANFQSIENNWWVYRSYASNSVIQVVDTLNNKKWQVNIDDWLREMGYLDNDQGIHRDSRLIDLDGNSVLLLEIEKMIVEDDVERIEEFQKKTGNEGKMPSDFDPTVVIVNLTKHVEDERLGNELDLKKIVELVDPESVFSGNETYETAFDVVNKSYYDQENTTLLIQHFTNFSDLLISQGLGSKREENLLNAVRFNNQINSNMFFFVVSVQDIDNHNLLNLFPTLKDDIEDQRVKKDEFKIFFKFNSVQSEKEMVELLIDDPNSVVIDESFKLKGYYSSLTEDMVFRDFDEIMDFLEEKQKDY